MRIERDDWLSGVLGQSSWKVNGLSSGDLSSRIRADMIDRAGHAPAFFSAKIPTTDVAAVGNATRAGFSVVDVNVTFDWVDTPSVGREGPAYQRGELIVETAIPDDAFAIEAIAAECFTFSRFHLDANIGAGIANEIKRQWARNACRGRASAIYVARRNGEVVGFLAALTNHLNSGSDAIIDLVGVAAIDQKNGTGRALSMMFIDQWRGRANRLRVGTQISNIPAIRLYESIGFRVAETTFVLHAHVNHGAVAA